MPRGNRHVMVSDSPDFNDPGTPNDEGGPGDTLRPSEALDADDVRNEGGDDVVDPPDEWHAADKPHLTATEQREGESLDEKLAAEEPDTPSADRRASRDPDIEEVDGTGVHRGQVDDTPEDGESYFPYV